MVSPKEPPAWQRVLLKLSGEALAGDDKFGIEGDILTHTAQELKNMLEVGVELGVVIGGGNFFRGMSAASQGMDRVSSDYIGMLATAMNALALQQALEALGVSARVLSAIEIRGVAEPYIRARALKHLSMGRVVIFAAGTGNPLFTTDTAASLRALEIGAEIMVKATRVDGVFDSDPEKNPQAMRFDRLSFDEVLQRKLKVMDMTAITLCQENQMPIQVLDLHQKGSLMKMVKGEPVGTLIMDRPES
ncbi:MAG: UMP kinase [Acidiferrobacterales bacterium]|nr:UMP kinase [Acidiferrobacterales bacterium]